MVSSSTERKLLTKSEVNSVNETDAHEGVPEEPSGRCSFTNKDSGPVREHDVRLLSPNETARYLGISVATLYRMVERRAIAVVRVSSSLRFAVSDIEAYVASRRTSPS